MPTLALTVLCLAAAVAALAAPSAAADRPFTARDLVTLERLGAPAIAPNGAQVLYDVRSTDLAANRGAHAMWLAALGGSSPTLRLGVSDGGATDAQWSADGRWIYFLSGRSGASQVWRTDGAGARATEVTHLPVDVQAYRVSPDGRRIVVALPVFADCPDLGCTTRRQSAREASKATGTVYDRVFVRHWDTWADGTDNHLFALALGADGAATGTAASLMRSLDGDVPSKPFGDESDFVISPDSRTVVFSMRLAGSSEPWSTNFDLWRVPIDGSVAPADITADNPAWDANPVFSPDGTQLAYRAQSVPGFESDRFRVMVRDLRSGRTTELAHDWDRSADAIAWSADGRTIYCYRTGRPRPPSVRDRRRVKRGQAAHDRGFGRGLQRRQEPDRLLAVDARRAGADLRFACGRRRRGPDHARQRRPFARRRTRAVRELHLRGLERRHGSRLRHEAGRLPARPALSRRVHHPRRPGGQLRRRVGLSLESADIRGPGLRGRVDRLPRLDRLRTGVHQRDRRSLGRPPARGSAKRLGGGARALLVPRCNAAPARSAHRTAAT